MKYIFITGGVVSSLGKGLTAAALGALLELRGLKVCIQKFDPYLNVDPGTMNPFQHGEVYVLDDGAETDLDLGHYERFTHGKLTRANSLSSGQIYETVLQKERRGDYLGNTVQVIPHVTDEIKARIHNASDEADVVITEIGGTTGDIEGLPFLEAMRQFALEVDRDDTLFIHVTLVPYLKASGELKTKPSQQSVARLREIGIQPDILVCRTEHTLSEELRKKLSLFCNIPFEAVIEEKDVDTSIYELPVTLHMEKVDKLIVDRLRLQTQEPNMLGWQDVVKRLKKPAKEVTIGVVGKYMELQDAYKSVFESLTHAGIANDSRINLIKVDAGAINETTIDQMLSRLDGILVPGGFGDRGTEGKILTAKYARENKIPYFGICLGLQIAVIEFARHVAGLEDAHSAEFDSKTKHPVILIMEDQKTVQQKGGSMRLGAYDCQLTPGSFSREAYGQDLIQERHRHRFEFNNKYRDTLEAKGLRVAGINPERNLVEIIEIADHPWFVGVQFHPEFKSKPNEAHPLFEGFVKASLINKSTPKAAHAIS